MAAATRLSASGEIELRGQVRLCSATVGRWEPKTGKKGGGSLGRHTSLVAKVRGVLVILTIVAATSIFVSPAYSAIPVRVLVTGDSIAQGSNGDYTWRYRLWEKLNAVAPGVVTFVGTRTDVYDNVNDRFGSQAYLVPFAGSSHAAEWGSSYMRELDRITSQITATSPDVLITMLGSNDLAYATSPAATIDNVRRYIQRARVARPGLDVVIGEVVDKWDMWSQSYTLTPQVNEYAQLLRGLATSMDTPSERVVVALSRTGFDARLHTWDGTHANSTGEGILAQRVSEALAGIGIGSASPDISYPRSWQMPGPPLQIVPGSEQASLAWNRTQSGANAMFIETRLVTINEAWHRLPYPVGGSGWTAALLAAGGTYDFRLVPAKGLAIGIAGPSSRVTVTGPTPATLAGVTVLRGGTDPWGGKTIHASWDPAANASGYMLSYRLLSNASSLPWTDLPYPVTATSWDFQLLDPGRYYQFRVQPIRGFLKAAWTSSSAVRTRGVPGDRAYVALGDSYSSGLGSDSHYSGGACYRTPNAWPYMLQSPWTAWTFHIACAGARVPDITAQINAADEFFRSHPGAPQLVTLTVGGNDSGFADNLKACVTGDCTGQEATITANINALQPVLTALYRKLRSLWPYADIVVGGYPSVVEMNGPSSNIVCSLLSGAERQMIDRLSNRLNTVIYSAARDSNVWTVGFRVRDLFEGHNACASFDVEWIHSWVGAIAWPPVKPDSFHPKWPGQYNYAVAFSDAILAYAN